MMETTGERPAFYMWTKRRGATKPDGAGLNRKRQRTGSDSTFSILGLMVRTGNEVV
jgi:hypothetical protein